MQVRQGLPELQVAFGLAPRERASYMKAELGPNQTEEDTTTVGGGLDISLRSWLRQVRALPGRTHRQPLRTAQGAGTDGCVASLTALGHAS